LVLVFAHSTISFILEFFEFQSKLLFVLLLFSEALFEGSNLFVPVLSGTIETL